MKQLILILITLVFLGILVGANIYLSKRFAWYFGLDSPRLLYFLFPALTLFMMVGVMALSNSTGIGGHLLYSLAAIIMGFLLFLLMAVILVDIGHFIIKVQPNYYGITALVLTVVVSLFSFLNASNLKITEVEAGISGLEKEVRIMQLSDIHLGHFRGKKFLQRIVDKTNNEDIEAVFITGDLFDGKIRFSDASLHPLKQFEVPVYFIEGNHDGYSGINQVKDSLRSIGVKVLENEVVEWNGLQIIGLDHMLADEISFDMHSSDAHETIKSVLPGIKTQPDKPTILLHHSPTGVQYAHEKGVDLYLAGHTHGGQLFPVNLIGSLLFKYERGLYDYKGTKIFVSQGAGTFGPPFRLGTKSELALIRLKPE